MRIDTLDTKQKVVVVAEVGNNHEGDFNLALKMVELAAQCGVDVVKFQTIRADSFCSKKNAQRYATLKKFEFSDEQFCTLAQAAKANGILFMSTPFDLGAVEMLNPLVPAFKIASGDLTFLPLVRAIARTGKPIILSTGMSTLAEVVETKSIIESEWQQLKIKSEIALLHCSVAYPTPPQEANLLAIRAIEASCNCTVGFSDHTIGIDAAILSVACGARIIEKHFTINKQHSTFRDHQLSADPDDMRLLVSKVREAEAMLGSGQKILQPTETANLVPVRRSIVAKRDLSAGHILTLEDLSWMRPGDGVKPGDESTVLGRRLNRALDAGDTLKSEYLS